MAATVAFALALVWYLYRYFSTARVSARPEPRKGLPVWQAFLWVLAAVVLSRLLLWLGGLAGACWAGGYIWQRDWSRKSALI